MVLVREDAGAAGASLAELKEYLRITGSSEDGLLEASLQSATALCEQFIGQWLIAGEARETVVGDASWQRLSARPVVAITGVDAVGPDGDAVALGPGDYAIDIDAAGDGWVRARPGGGQSVLAVRYQAGMAQEVEGLPAPIREGIIRLAAEHFAARSGDVASPPAVVSALWRPLRRMRLT
ncbi:head-tail connector protein [Sphingobium mellinum]|uniref:head-tail connector protein n=1 Tax=Sphingobium mellinum TaxID=1387166 RepID=UPI0030EE8A0B